MSIVPLLKRFVPRPLRPPLRKCYQRLWPSSYQTRIQSEIQAFADEHVLDIPPIMYYWAEKYLRPMLSPLGFGDSVQFFRTYLARACRNTPNRTCTFLSIGAGSCATEIKLAEWLREEGISNYTFECIDINSDLLSRGRVSTEEKGLAPHFVFRTSDVNKWRTKH